MRRLAWLLGLPVAACAVATVTGEDAGGLDAGKDVAAVDVATADTSSDTGGPSDSGVDAPIETGTSGPILKVNEVAPNITGSADLIELMATKGGDIGGITIEQDITTKVVLATLPSIVVASGDFIVVHLKAPGTVVTETTSKT